MGEAGKGMIDPVTSLLNVNCFYERIILERFTEALETKAKRINWIANDSARLAHVLADKDAVDALRLLTHGATREELDVGLKKTDAFDVFATLFNDSSKTYAHPCPENLELFQLDPNSPSPCTRSGEKLKDIYRSIQASLTRITANYTASGNGGEKPFFAFCSGDAVAFYFHKVWESNPMYSAMVRLAPGGIEEGSGSSPAFILGKRKRAVPRINAPATPKHTPSLVGAAEEKYFESQAKLTDMQFIHQKIEALKAQLPLFQGHEMHAKITAKILVLMDDLLQ
jgi:hypothetical protein